MALMTVTLITVLELGEDADIDGYKPCLLVLIVADMIS